MGCQSWLWRLPDHARPRVWQECSCYKFSSSSASFPGVELPTLASSSLGPVPTFRGRGVLGVPPRIPGQIPTTPSNLSLGNQWLLLMTSEARRFQRWGRNVLRPDSTQPPPSDPHLTAPLNHVELTPRSVMGRVMRRTCYSSGEAFLGMLMKKER